MMIACVRCGAPASSLMAYSYSDRHIWLEELLEVGTPGYAMCASHADRLAPPRGWTLTDRRRVVPLFAPLEVA